jgi:hypothetical protein
MEEKVTGSEEETGAERPGGKGWWGRKRKVQAGKKRQVWGDKEEKSGAGRESYRQGRRDRGGETREEEAGGVGKEWYRQGRRDRCGETRRKKED